RVINVGIRPLNKNGLPDGRAHRWIEGRCCGVTRQIESRQLRVGRGCISSLTGILNVNSIELAISGVVRIEYEVSKTCSPIRINEVREDLLKVDVRRKRSAGLIQNV